MPSNWIIWVLVALAIYWFFLRKRASA
jgi:hypothetical protein